MGRKKKPLHLKRQPCTVSLPLDVHAHLHKISEAGMTVSRYVESIVRREMEGNQRSLVRHHWLCPNENCAHEWHTNNPDVSWAYCRRCNTTAEYQGVWRDEEE